MPDFPVKASRMASCCVQYLVKHGGAQHHEVWRLWRLGAMDYVVDMHETLCRIADNMGTYDQLDLSNSAAAEFLSRKLHLLETLVRREGRGPDDAVEQ